MRRFLEESVPLVADPLLLLGAAGLVVSLVRAGDVGHALVVVVLAAGVAARIEHIRFLYRVRLNLERSVVVAAASPVGWSSLASCTGRRGGDVDARARDHGEGPRATASNPLR